MKVPHLDVSLYGEPIGRLERHGEAGARFVPDDAWIYNRFQPLLGLSWRADGRVRTSSTSVPAWFENLLPDRGTALRERICADLKVAPDDDLSLLAGLGGDLPGAVVITSATEPAAPGAGRELEVTESTGELHFSLAGMQLKFSLSLRDSKLTLPLRGEAGDHIAKIPSQELPGLVAVELRTLDWAERAGFDVARHWEQPIRSLGRLEHLEQVPGETCLVLARYDRTPTGRLHQEDLAQAFGLRPANKYAEHSRAFTAEDLLAFARDLLGQAGAAEAARRLAFILASGNTDAHLKNWSLLLPRDAPVRLAPLYDQISVITWRDRFGWGHPTGPKLAMSMAGRRSMAEIDQGSIRELTGGGALEEAFMDSLLRAREAWADLREVATRPHREAVDEHWERVPALREVALRG